MKSEHEKARQILAKRRLAAKGLKEREDGAPVDPLQEMTSLDPDDKRAHVDPLEERDASLAKAAALGRVH